MTWPTQATITGITMQLSHFIFSPLPGERDSLPAEADAQAGVREVPVWQYTLNNIQYNYINHNLKPSDLL